jgi:transposase-like protein
MSPSRRTFSREFKAEVLERLAAGVPVREVASAYDLRANVVRRWRRESAQYGDRAFKGYGKPRSEFTPRTKQVVFHLTPAEFDALKQAISSSGARSMSEFARTQVLRGCRTTFAFPHRGETRPNRAGQPAAR